MRTRLAGAALSLGLLSGPPVSAADGPPQRSVLGLWLRWEKPDRPAPHPPGPPPAAADPAVRRVQEAPGGSPMALPVAPSPMTPGPPTMPAQPVLGSQSISLQAALYGTLTNNPDLVTLRQGSPIANAPSPEAVEVARRFPTALNPTVWIDYRPITLIPRDPFGGNPGGSGSGTGTGKNTGHHGFYHSGQNYLLVSYRQPIELGHQTTHRYHIARASLDQQRWTVTQAELTALVQTYRFFQTAAYRRERQRVARDLADFNERLLQTLQRRLEANQGAASDVVLARVESRATRQQARAAQQDYVTALTDLRNQVGIPETAGAAEPLGEFTLPPYIPRIDEQTMVQTALANRPDIHAAEAQVRAAEAAVRLAKGDRLPTPVVGPQYAIDEAGIQYVGLIYVTPLPILNSGKPLVIQREAEARRACVALQEARQRAVAQVRAAVARWNGATELVAETGDLAGELSGEVARLERLFEEGQADLPRLMQARQRLIQLENARLDAVWAATQAQADLLLALGTPTLIQGMLARAEAGAGVNASGPSNGGGRVGDRAPGAQ